MSEPTAPDPASPLSLEDARAAARALLSELSGHVEAAKAAALTAQTRLTEATEAVTSALASRTEIENAQTVVDASSQHIRDAQIHADEARVELDRSVTAVTKSATEAEAMAVRAKSASDAATATQAEIGATKVTSLAEAQAVLAARDEAKAASEATKALAEKAATIEAALKNYEASLENLAKESAAQLKEIVRLLPGATSAGLAHAFDQRRQTFLDPGKRWQWLFIGSVVALVVLAATGLWGAIRPGATLSYDELFRLWIARLPIAAALVWLALHSSRESALAKRLEEDYGYKAAVASSFQGFFQQLADVDTKGADRAALARLCEDTLGTIARPPGRIYDNHKLTVTPSDQAAEIAKAVVGEVAKLTGPKQ